jgi:hypothetical protein
LLLSIHSSLIITTVLTFRFYIYHPANPKNKNKNIGTRKAIVDEYFANQNFPMLKFVTLIFSEKEIDKI